jgi:hypothetical protein
MDEVTEFAGLSDRKKISVSMNGAGIPMFHSGETSTSLFGGNNTEY